MRSSGARGARPRKRDLAPLRLRLLPLLLALTPLAHAQLAAQWSGFTGGTLGGSTFTVQVPGAQSLGGYPFQGSDFAAAPFGAQALTYHADSTWTVSFQPPVTHLRVYCGLWRGAGGQVSGSTAPTSYTFDATPHVLSGLSQASLTGATLSCPSSAFHDGILEFVGPVASLTCTSSAGTNNNQLMTFGLPDPAPLGAPYCGPAAANSTGASATLRAAGSAQANANAACLIAEGLPPNQFAYFLASTTQGLVAGPGGSQGTLCLGGAIGRYNGPGQVLSTGTGGAALLALDLSATPTPSGPVAIAAGQTWNFQCWYRDANPAATSNFTEGLSIAFL